MSCVFSVLQYTILGESFQVAQDPFGRDSRVTLEDVLTFPPGERPITRSEIVDELAQFVPVGARQREPSPPLGNMRKSSAPPVFHGSASVPLRMPSVGRVFLPVIRFLPFWGVTDRDPDPVSDGRPSIRFVPFLHLLSNHIFDN